MKTKLTLTVEKDIIDQAKKYARDTGVSLSDLVQSYLQRIADGTSKTQNQKVSEKPSKYRKMAGIAKSDLDPVKDRDKLREIRLEKYKR